METSANGLILAAAGGIVLGCGYFAGLWWTVRRLPVSRRPALFGLMSFLVRAGAAVAGLFLLTGGRAAELGAGLLAFIAARGIMTRVVEGRLALESSGVEGED